MAVVLDEPEVTTGESSPAQPDYRLDPDGPAARLMARCIADARANVARQDRDRQDWRNLLLYRGDHFRVWDRGTQQYVERGYDPERGGLPEYVPRITTNVFANKIDGIASILTQSNPAKEVTPATDDDRDIAAAKVAEDAIPVLFEEIGYESLKARAALLVTLVDKVFLVPYYDTDAKYGTQAIPDYQCTACGQVIPSEEVPEDQGDTAVCPVCGGGPLTMALDPLTQAPISYREEPIGKICCELVPSFEASLPSAARVADVKQVPWILMHTRMSVDDIERRWPEARALGLRDRRGGNASASAGLSRHFADAMTALSAPTRASRHTGGDGSQTHPVVYRLQHDPIYDRDCYFPDGLFAVMVDDQLVEAGPLPVKDSRGRPAKAAVCWQFRPAPGTAFGKPPADDLGPLQDTRNIIESLATLILMHEAAPRLFIPMGVTLETEPTGAPGETIYYRSLNPGERPVLAPGTNPPPALYRHLELLDQKMDELSGLNAVLQGSRPEGGQPTLGEIEILQERGMSAFKPATDQMALMEKQLCLLLLYIARDSAWSPRFRQILGENGEYDVRAFSGADLQGNIDIRIDPASAWPKSPLMERQMLKEAFAMGLFPPPAQDPELAAKVARMLSLSHLKPSLGLDHKQVGRKLTRWKAATRPEEIAPPDPTTESLPVHHAMLSAFLKTEEFEELQGANPPVAQAMVQHVQMIGQLLAQQAAAQQAAAAPQGAGGEGAVLDAAVASGALQPAGAVPPPADPLDALMASGALQPAAATAEPGVSIDELAAARMVLPLSAEHTQPPTG